MLELDQKTDTAAHTTCAALSLRLRSLAALPRLGRDVALGAAWRAGPSRRKVGGGRFTPGGVA